MNLHMSYLSKEIFVVTSGILVLWCCVSAGAPRDRKSVLLFAVDIGSAHAIRDRLSWARIYKNMLHIKLDKKNRVKCSRSWENGYILKRNKTMSHVSLQSLFFMNCNRKKKE